MSKLITNKPIKDAESDIKSVKAGRPRNARIKPKPLFLELSKKGFDLPAEIIKLYEAANLEDKVSIMKTLFKHVYTVPAPSSTTKVDARQNHLTIENSSGNPIEALPPAKSVPAEKNQKRLKELMDIAKSVKKVN